MENDLTETVYGTHEDSHVMSERVQNLAGSIYKEFERMIKVYDENVVKELMPLVVGILESLDCSYLDKQENEVELELLRDDNEQLLTQYEREKQLRKTAEQKYLEVEDSKEEERKDLQGKVESLESIVRMFELKAKNAQDHISRLDDKEQEMRKEYSKLHERYTELFKTHMDYMERTKLVMGTERFIEMGNQAKGKIGFNLPNLKAVTPPSDMYGAETPVKSGTSPPSMGLATPNKAQDSHTSLKSELRELDSVHSKEAKDSLNVAKADTAEKKQETDEKQDASVIQDAQTSAAIKAEREKVQSKIKSIVDAVKESKEDSGSYETLTYVGDLTPPSSGILVTPELEDIESYPKSTDKPVSIAGASKSGNESSIFDELQFNEEALGEVDDGADITVSDNFFGMGKEVENLILENTELLATKNALNVVKDDLIAKVDELSSEQEILREEITSLQTVKDRLKQKVSELEDELKKTKEELEKAKNAKSGDGEGDEEDVPMAQRKRFTRVEMARVLMERNQYKERLMELQEAVRWTEMIRASREHPELVTSGKKKGSIWNFFSNLVGPGDSASSSNSASSSGSSKKKSKSYAVPTVI